MPDILGGARPAGWMESALRDTGRVGQAGQFRDFDWRTQKGAFIDGRHRAAHGGEPVTYDRHRAMGTNGFQEPANAYVNGAIEGMKRLRTGGASSKVDPRACFMRGLWRGPQAEGERAQERPAVSSSTISFTLKVRRPS